MRNRALEYCSHDWVFSLDADEHCTQAVRDEIVALLAGTPAHDAYFIERYNYFLGRWIRGSGYYRDHRTPQLFRKSCLRYTPSLSHEAFELESARPGGTLKNQILHFPLRRIEEMMMKANRYSSLGAEARAGRKVSMWGALACGRACDAPVAAPGGAGWPGEDRRVVATRLSAGDVRERVREGAGRGASGSLIRVWAVPQGS